TEALERLGELKSNGVAVGEAAQLFVDAAPWLQQVNKLRNRIWHRGRFILKCKALDTLMGCYVLPFVQKLSAIQPYDSVVRGAQHKPLHCGISPCDEIIKRSQTTSGDAGAIAFLKEMGRAAYESPLYTGMYAEMLNEEHRARAQVLTHSQERDAADTRDCPVCGLHTLLLFDDVDDVSDENGPKYVRHTYAAKCMCCGFYVTDELKNPKEYGLPFKDYWTHEEI